MDRDPRRYTAILGVPVDDVVEIGAWRYDVVSDPLSGVALEPVITQTVAEIQDELDLDGVLAAEAAGTVRSLLGGAA
ncbi:hypothetical protein AB0L40_08365 [Patulibacter sp. NPDC049589]|uniref:hypothetical protein n=1 Tax=Patulibacter sp. NPDC049589 TaxID=3154731 RepID=UPI0034444165